MGMCGLVQALKAERPAREEGLSSTADSGSGPWRGELRGISAGGLSRRMLRPVCDGALVMQGSGLTTGGRLPDTYKPGPDGVSWGGMGLGKASWTAAQCGDCLSAQALGHAATPHWARAPALGFQRDVTGDWLSLSVAGSPLQQLLQCPPTSLMSQPPAPPSPVNAPPPALRFQP